MKPLRIGTRGSALALWQARTVAGLLERQGRAVELVTIRTAGDRLQERPLTETGSKGLFVKEIEDALLAGEIDIGYVGPGPAINAHLKTDGTGIRVVGAAASNGVTIVVRGDACPQAQHTPGQVVIMPGRENARPE